MAKKNNPEDTVKVLEVASRSGVVVGKPKKVVTTAMRPKVAFPLAGSTSSGSGGNFYSPELSTDFLELPQSIDEQRNFYRFFYDYDPFVGQAIDLSTDLPLSKLRVGMPNARNRELAERAMRFCTKWAKRVKLLQRLLEITHEWNLIGEVYPFLEDTNPDMPREVREQLIREITAEGEMLERWEPYPDADEREIKWLNQNYKGWTAIRCLPPEQVRVEFFPFADKKLVELIIDSKTKAIVNQASNGDERAREVVESMPQEIVDAVLEGRNLPLNTDPDAGSFVHVMARKRSPYEPRGKSVLGRCLLPGTPIWIKRNGVIQQVHVESVDDKTDLLLTHKGRFMPCKAGSRPVDEDVVCLTIDGIEESLRLTANHEVLRIQEDGMEEWVEAGKLRVGDWVREAHVVQAENPITLIDLGEWWRDRTIDVVKRGRPKMALPETARKVSVVATTTTDRTLQVEFQYDNDNRNRARSTPAMSKLLAWAGNLSEPVVRTQAEVAQEAGVTERDVRVYAPRLRKEGLIRAEAKSLGRGKGQQVTWHPSAQTDLPKVNVDVMSYVHSIQVTEDFCYLLGTWLGDGCVWTEKESPLNASGLGWSLHEPELEDVVLRLIRQCLGDVKIKQGCVVDRRATSRDVFLEDALLARFFMEEFGHGADGKRLPSWVFHLPENHVLSLLRGLLDTDGWLKKGQYPRIEITLTNKVLLDQVHLLCNRLGIRTKVSTTEVKAHEWTRSWETKDGIETKTYHYPQKQFALLTCSRIEDTRKWADHCLCVKGKRVRWDVLQGRDEDKRGCPKQIGGWITRRLKGVRVDPYVGNVYSFDVSEDESHVTGVVTHNCLRTLVFRDKVRQSLTSIASRHMTPYRLIYGLDMSDDQTEALRDQVDLALQDPDYSIITNFEINWQEMGADQRLPDWSWVFELTDRQMYAGLGVTESLLSGESSYSGDRIHLEVINTRFMLLREMLQDLVEEYFFKPMCARMGFVEEDEDGNMEVIVPKLSFTRLALRDTQDTYDALFNLYQKGSVPVSVILDLLNIDPISAEEGLKSDFGGFNDSTMNEVLRAAYSRVGDALVEGSNLTEKIAKNLGLTYKKPAEEGRF